MIDVIRVGGVTDGNPNIEITACNQPCGQRRSLAQHLPPAAGQDIQPRGTDDLRTVPVSADQCVNIDPVKDRAADDPHTPPALEKAVKSFWTDREHTTREETDGTVKTGTQGETLFVQVSPDHDFISSIFQP